jgi:hypothetical protein
LPVPGKRPASKGFQASLLSCIFLHVRRKPFAGKALRDKSRFANAK